jgi:hypothetical protein
MLGSLRHRIIGNRASTWVVLAFAVRALVPDGFMVGTSPGGGATIVFCHGAGLAVPTAGGHPDHAHHQPDPSHHARHSPHAGHAGHGGSGEPPSDDDSHHAQQGQCAFAASAVLAPPPPPSLGTGHVLAADEFTREPHAIALPSERDRRPGARAPPAHS